MSKPPTEEEIDREVARIMALSDEEVIAEMKAQGLDIWIEAAKCKSVFELAMADCAFRDCCRQFAMGLPFCHDCPACVRR